MPSTLNSQEYQYSLATAQGLWQWTIRMDVTGVTPVFSVTKIKTPWGLLRDSIPIPGDVIAKMADGMDELTTAFAPRILLSTNSLTLTLDEGRGFGDNQPVTVTNNGAFGSLLGATITSSAGYVAATPATLGGLPVNGVGTFQVNADSTSLTAINSPYTSHLTVQDPNAVNTPQTVNVTVNVRPKATIGVYPEELDYGVGGPIGGPWPAIPAQTFQIVNTGAGSSVLDYQIEQLDTTANWITSITPMYGTVPGGSAVNITVNVAPTTNMQPGTYEQYLRVSGYSSNFYADVYVVLVVS